MKRITPYSIALFSTLLIVWGLGLLLINYTHYIEKSFSLFGMGIINTLFAVGFFTLLFSPLFLLKKRTETIGIILHVFFCLIIFVEIASLLYFNITLTLLDKTIFQFDSGQAGIIMESYFVFKWYYLLSPLPFFAYFLLFQTLPKVKNIFLWSVFILSGLIYIFSPFKAAYNGSSFDTLPENKTLFFVKSLFSHSNKNASDLTIDEIRFYQQMTNPENKNPNYPLYHKLENENTLGAFFDLKQKPPNIKVIFVESWSADFSGPNAGEISYTPFLDSLANHSLLFDNFVATSNRSFAGLPSTLGSLPHGKNGFTNHYASFPNYESLPSWLFENGYRGDFQYGGYANFDFMDLFMKNQGFEHIIDQKEFNYEGTGLKTSVDSIPFGIPDGEFLQRVSHYEAEREKDSENPFIDVYFTLSMHYPYMIPNHEMYYKEVNRLIDKNETVSQEVKRKHRKYIKELATFRYTDDAFKDYFKSEKKRDSYENTIYILVGDHGMGEIAHNSPIFSYHPMIIIYSPLLKRRKVIKGLNSHLDIAPSFYQLLANRYDFSTLDSVAWLGQPFDTSFTFQANRDVLFMVHDRTTEDLIHREFYYYKDNLYQISDRLHLTKIESKPTLRDSLKKLLEISTKIHKEVTEKDRILPRKE